MLAPSKDSLRYEIKMVCHESDGSSIAMMLRYRTACLRTLYPGRRVQSIYFDTPEGRALNENLSGISHREKLRFRWYGDDTTQVFGNLECKVRENALGWKATLSLGEPFDVEGTNRWEFVQRLRRRCPPDWEHELSSGYEPVQWISYWREYLVNANGRLRVTVDSDLRCFDLRHRYVLSPRYQTPLPNVRIIEVKFAPEHYRDSRELLYSFPLLIDKCSKFVLASDPLDGPVVSLFQGGL